jgi:hypothetical protein
LAVNTNGGTFGQVHAKNSIFANNGGADCIESQGYNLVTDPCSALTGPGDISGVDPQLTGLQDNGGATLTHALYPGSPAIDAADNSVCPAADQRGTPRPQGAACDIGAYEYVAPPPRPPTAPPDDTTPPEVPETGTATPVPTPKLPSPSPSPSPTPSAAPSATARKRDRTPTFTPVLIDVEPVEEELSEGGVSIVVSGLAAAGTLGLIGSAAGGGYYWLRLRRRRNGLR